MDTAFLTSIRKSDFIKAQEILQTGEFMPHHCQDSQGCTALHIAAQNGHLSMAQLLVHHMQQHYGTQARDLMQVWANTQTRQGSTALHFACFQGNIVSFTQKIAQLLVKIGARVDLVTDQRSTLMHVAAQTGQPLLLAYLRELGMSFVTLDATGNTPLHWAAYMGAETACSLLLAWGSPPNLQERNGNSPLHLAVGSGHSRIVRNLLVKGAKRELRNNENKRPIDIAMENAAANLISALKPPGCLAECKLKPPLRPPQANYLSVSAFILLFGGGNVVCSLLNISYAPLCFRVAYMGLVFLTILCFIVLLLRDPGYLNKGVQVRELDLYEKYDSALICPDCNIVKPARSRHCISCDRCVDKFDHHCPWVNNCIGARNLGWFYAFINLTWVTLVCDIALGYLTLKADTLEAGIVPVTLWVSKGVGIAGIVLDIIFLLPLSRLVYQHHYNFCSNRTTYERFRKRQNLDETLSNTSFAKDESNCWKNWWRMCCNSHTYQRRSVKYRQSNESQLDLQEIFRSQEQRT